MTARYRPTPKARPSRGQGQGQTSLRPKPGDLEAKADILVVKPSPADITTLSVCHAGLQRILTENMKLHVCNQMSSNKLKYN